MAVVAEDKSAAVPRTSQRSSSESRPSKVVKKQREKKTPKGLDVDALIEAAETKSSESDDTQDNKEKKAQGIVIDGRTYTCATCKTGHRVGICKHAKERPMTATHPPGRPPAGAPKKVVCDCPKQCSCKKRDCKCARKCSCTQMMYMLVYIPAPGEHENIDEERGTWKLGKQVTTDLKGNILTEEQVKERQEQKEAQKSQTPERRTAVLSTSALIENKEDNPPKAEFKPEAEGGCCKHKDNVSTEKIIAEASPHTGKVSRSAAEGCNCGHSCACAFCPQHPNNSTSINMARQQAMHFANQPYYNNHQSIIPFLPTLPSEASCMGGLPQFAISRFSQRPSQFDVQQAFPQPGFVIAYPVVSNRVDHAGYPMAPFPVQPHFLSDTSLMNEVELNGHHPPLTTPQVEPTHSDFPYFEYTPDEFDIGNAFVTSAGSGDWGNTFPSPTTWPMGSSVTTPVINSFMDGPQILNQAHSHADLNRPSIFLDSAFELPDISDAHIENSFFDKKVNTTKISNTEIQHSPPVRSCCGGATNKSPVLDSDDRVFNDYVTPFQESASPVSLRPDG